MSEVSCIFKPYNYSFLVTDGVRRDLDWRDLIMANICSLILFVSSQLFDVKWNVTKWASLFPLLVLAIKPVSCALDTEQVVTPRDFEIRAALFITFHADLAVLDVKGVVGFGVLY